MPQLKTQPPASTNVSAPAPILRAANLAKTFRMGDSRLQVLKNVDLSVREGEFLAIEGRSGSGKSTLLHLLGALDTADSGQIFYDGQDISKLSSAARGRVRNRQFGFVFQFYHLLPELNVLENALLGPMIEFSFFGYRAKKKELKQRAVEILGSLGMDHRLKHRPSQLSGGERQRVAIARALLNQPRVIFADEPTGNLDAETGRQIMGVLENLHATRRQTIIMVTHDRTLAGEADRVLVLKDGVLQGVPGG
ncbi:MAG: ABC transporter ATP-binding protein [Tepidisphaeraceae bacterium]|jgi:lipoprotein-releasing system ATP-binding protein